MISPTLVKRCFLSLECCAPNCMAYEEDGAGQPVCVLLLAAGTFAGAMIGLSKAQQTSVKYPASPPAPEVK